MSEAAERALRSALGEASVVARDRAVLLAALKAVRDQTIAVQHSQETRLNDIYDIANAVIRKVTE